LKTAEGFRQFVADDRIMRKIRFNIASLLLVVLVAAVGCAALRESTDIWDSSVLTLTLAVLLMSVLLAYHRAEKGRAFWLGFAVFGWAYLGLSLVPSIESRLITTKALRYLDFAANRDNDGSLDLYIANNSQPSAIYLSQGNTGFFVDALAGKSLGVSIGTTGNFIRIGHALLALIIAFLGGQLSRQLSSLHDRQR
jgi:hypothetical protein